MPALLSVLAISGVVLAGFGATSSMSTAMRLLQSRDELVRLARDDAARTPSPVIPVEELQKLAEREADVRYQRRNAELPLRAIDFILSCLLFAGCTRALRGDGWGVSAWQLAATVGIPYQLLDVALTLVQSRELEAVIKTVPAPLSIVRLMWVEAATLGGIFLAGFEVVYLGACLLYLRQPAVRALFSDGRKRTTPSA